eukprot:2444801-Prymnesium_polylepis.1
MACGNVPFSKVESIAPSATITTPGPSARGRRGRKLCAAAKLLSLTTNDDEDVLHPDHAPPPGKTDTHFT